MLSRLKVNKCMDAIFVNLSQSGQFNEDMIPTVGFNMRKITKGNVTIKVRTQWVVPYFSDHFKISKENMPCHNDGWKIFVVAHVLACSKRWQFIDNLLLFSSFGISEANLDSAACGSDIAVVSMLSCKFHNLI